MPKGKRVFSTLLEKPSSFVRRSGQQKGGTRPIWGAARRRYSTSVCGSGGHVKEGVWKAQETVARIHYRGNVNRLLAGLRASRPMAAESTLFLEDREAGLITSAAISPRLGAIGLGYLRRELATAGTTLELAAEDGTILEVQVSDLPFQPEGE